MNNIGHIECTCQYEQIGGFDTSQTMEIPQAPSGHPTNNYMPISRKPDALVVEINRMTEAEALASIHAMEQRDATFFYDLGVLKKITTAE